MNISKSIDKIINLILNNNLEYNEFIIFLQKNNLQFYQLIMKVKNNDIVFKKIIKLINIDYDFIINSVKIIETTFYQNNHKKKYCHEYYLILIYFMLNNFNQWSSLKLCILYDNTSKYHYKCVNKQFILYTSKNIFKQIFIKSSNNDIVSNNSNLLIDASLINNKYGNENVSINPEYKKKNGTKISFITNTDKIFLSITPFTINEKVIDYDKLKKINIEKRIRYVDKKNKIKNIILENKLLKKEIKNIKFNKEIKNKNFKLNKNNDVKLNEIIINDDIKLNEIIINDDIKLNEKIIKKNVIKTSVHDVMTIQISLNNINIKFNNNEKLNLTGDLGYLSNKKYYYNLNEVQLITPLRKNQNKKIKTIIESDNLKQRYKIENGFCLLKKYERIALRKDKKINTFMSFLYIVCSIENNKIIKNLENNKK